MVVIMVIREHSDREVARRSTNKMVGQLRSSQTLITNILDGHRVVRRGRIISPASRWDYSAVAKIEHHLDPPDA